MDYNDKYKNFDYNCCLV